MDEALELQVAALPQTIHQPVHPGFPAHMKYNIPEQYVLEIPNGRVLGPNGYILAPDDRLIGGLSREFKINDAFHRMSVFRSIKLPGVQRIKGTVASVAYPGGAYNYFHWIFDVLPRLGLLEMDGGLDRFDKIVINEFRFPFHRQLFSHFGIPEEKLIFAGRHTHIEADHLVVPSIPEYHDFIPQWSLDYLRKKISYNFDNNGGHPRRIYITRRTAKKRRLLNEDALISQLIPLGFSIVEPEKLSVEQQASVFHHADLIIAPHGAGQSNLLFCRPGTKIIEIFPPAWVNVCYWNMANSLGLDYYYIMGEKPAVAHSKAGVEDDLLINPEHFRLTLELAGLKD
ncbi:MAG: glycosyltransferase family 61 protein [Candidatus Pseudobacter hemicellulosilyticus]|uniref:Glycosyltransferase family 61 protein n=1 Tax=Candidatus Pseudobacter hemicellulosilyticus TaxID=3121375 RepID=A0AAJ6BIR3_9BACT|nr:MAG: glycosyltransferase family 61 protein [Pseudobacter sp.]